MDLFLLRTWLQARFIRDQRGANLVEYVLLVSLIAILLIGAVKLFGAQLSPKYSQAGSQLSSVSGP
jgi:Flp pilus assembly pilin Flp